MTVDPLEVVGDQLDGRELAAVQQDGLFDRLQPTQFGHLPSVGEAVPRAQAGRGARIFRRSRRPGPANVESCVHGWVRGGTGGAGHMIAGGVTGVTPYARRALEHHES